MPVSPTTGALASFLATAPSLLDAFNAFGFELRLGGDGEIDFAGVIERGCLALPSSPPFDSALWDAVRALYARWECEGSVERAAVSHVFLEFDTSKGIDQLRFPSVFLGVSPAAQFSCGGGRYAPNPAVGSLCVVPPLIEGLLGRPFDDRARDRLAECLSALPTGSILLHVGLMLSRSRAIRIHLGVPSHVAQDYLEEIGVESVSTEVGNLIARYGAGAPLATLQLEVGERIADAIGIEFAPGSGLDGATASAWKALLTRLTEDGLCRPEKRDALLAWPSVSRAATDGNGPLRWIRRDLSHVKITVRRDEPLRAKAYLSVTPSASLFGDC